MASSPRKTHVAASRIADVLRWFHTPSPRQARPREQERQARVTRRTPALGAWQP